MDVGSIHGPGKGVGHGVGKQREVDSGVKRVVVLATRWEWEGKPMCYAGEGVVLATAVRRRDVARRRGQSSLSTCVGVAFSSSPLLTLSSRFYFLSLSIFYFFFSLLC